MEVPPPEVQVGQQEGDRHAYRSRLDAGAMETSGDIADARILWSLPLFWQSWSQLSCSAAEYAGSGDGRYLHIYFLRPPAMERLTP
jgi:hypothetical protein